MMELGHIMDNICQVEINSFLLMIHKWIDEIDEQKKSYSNWAT